MTNLHEEVKKRLLKAMVEPNSAWKVLVVDDYSTRIISSLLKMTDLSAANISVVEKLNLKRKPMKEMEAIYFISPSKESIKKVLEDFLPHGRLYARGHVFLTSALSDELFDSLVANSPSLKYLSNITELNVDFLVAEAQLFMTSFQKVKDDDTSSFYKVFSPRADTLRDPEYELLARQITTVCASLGEYPLIRYDGEGVATKQLAAMVQSRLDDLQRDDPDAFTDGPKSTLLILDRAVDVVAPFLHEFTYQAMVQDLLMINDNHYKYKAQSVVGQEVMRDVLLDEEDTMWAHLRHMHIAEVIDTISKEFNEFKASNKAAAGRANANKDMKAATELMRDLPQYTALLGKYSLHMNMSQDAMKKFNDGNIQKVAEIEQDMATRQTVDGETLNENDVMLRVKEALRDDKVSGGDKARLVMQYIAYHGPLAKEDKQALGLDQVGFSAADMQAFSNLNYITANKDVIVNIDKSKKKKANVEEDVPYHLSRFVPALKKIAEELITNSLDSAKYPYVKPPPEDDASAAAKKGQSARTTKANWADKVPTGNAATSSLASKNHDNKESRYLIFVAGGITYSELRTIYQLNNKNVLIGSSNIWKPIQFVEALRELNKEVVKEVAAKSSK